MGGPNARRRGVGFFGSTPVGKTRLKKNASWLRRHEPAQPCLKFLLRRQTCALGWGEGLLAPVEQVSCVQSYLDLQVLPAIVLVPCDLLLE